MPTGDIVVPSAPKMMEEPASTRALGVFEILELVAASMVDELDNKVDRGLTAAGARVKPDSRLPIPPRSPASERWAAVLAARAVARSWQSIFDRVFLRFREYANTLRCEGISLNHPVLAVPPTGARVGCGLKRTYSGLAFLSGLEKMTVEESQNTLHYLCPRIVKGPALWPALTTLTIELTSMAGIIGAAFHGMLSALVGLNRLRFAAHDESDAVDGKTAHWIALLRRLPTKITRIGVLAKGGGKTALSNLLAVLRVNLPPSVVELELLLTSIYSRNALSVMLPPGVKRLSVNCQRALCVPLLQLLADFAVLPKLVQAPAISFDIADTVDASQIRLPTVQAVHVAVAGLFQRPNIADYKEAEHRLYSLLEASGLSPCP